ncbi:uncharacterized protein LOC123199380 isoform X2 [Mangifera indica]|uniref:uncharacterized protein LOC123199380 isoform X2 n=1 Tax=Mangifera indica TaxID=29780 RepID=UPI001CFB0C46|nr:uncharacterized protein LOC123199380 isoform X2 [Mangifera indica]
MVSPIPPWYWRSTNSLLISREAAFRIVVVTCRDSHLVRTLTLVCNSTTIYFSTGIILHTSRSLHHLNNLLSLLKLGVLLPKSPVLLVSSAAGIRVQCFYKRQYAERSSSSGVHSHYGMVGWILAGILWFPMIYIHSKHGLCSFSPSVQGNI